MRIEESEISLAPEPGFVPLPVDTAWFQDRLRALGKTQAAMAASIGVRPAAVSLLLKGTRVARAAEAEGIAAFLNVPVHEVLQRLGVAAADAPHRQVPVVAVLENADLVVRVDPTLAGDAFWAEAPPDLVGAEAIVVRGSDAAPRFYPGDTLYFSRVSLQKPAQLVGRTVVGELADGRLFVKRLMLGGAADTVTLLSFNPHVLPLVDQRVVWLSPVAWVRPA